MPSPMPIPITILTGFLGSGKTTLILNLLPQLPSGYRLALLKNEFGDVAIDSQLTSSASSSSSSSKGSISDVKELLNGCICCNLVGQLSEALETLSSSSSSSSLSSQGVSPTTNSPPDRIIIETSGSAFPATLAMEVNRLSRPTENQEGIQKYILDGVITVIDVENWKGYEDTSFTAKLQARFTDLVVWNKWEDVDERRFDECLDRLADLEVDVATVRSKRGWVPMKALLGLDRRMEVRLEELESRHEHEHHESGHDHDAEGNHHSEVEVLSISLMVGLEDGERRNTVMDVEKLEELLKSAPKDEVYRIKAIMKTDYLPLSSDGISSTAMGKRSTNGVEINGFKKEDGNNDNEIGNWEKQPVSCILNWAFGRWTFFEIPSSSSLKQEKETGTVSGQQKQQQQDNPDGVNGLTKTVDPILRMTVVLARGEGEKWKKRIQQKKWLCVKNQDENESILTVEIKR